MPRNLERYDDDKDERLLSDIQLRLNRYFISSPGDSERFVIDVFGMHDASRYQRSLEHILLFDTYVQNVTSPTEQIVHILDLLLSFYDSIPEEFRDIRSAIMLHYFNNMEMYIEEVRSKGNYNLWTSLLHFVMIHRREYSDYRQRVEYPISKSEVEALVAALSCETRSLLTDSNQIKVAELIVGSLSTMDLNAAEELYDYCFSSLPTQSSILEYLDALIVTAIGRCSAGLREKVSQKIAQHYDVDLDYINSMVNALPFMGEDVDLKRLTLFHTSIRNLEQLHTWDPHLPSDLNELCGITRLGRYQPELLREQRELMQRAEHTQKQNAVLIIVTDIDSNGATYDMADWLFQLREDLKAYGYIPVVMEVGSKEEIIRFSMNISKAFLVEACIVSSHSDGSRMDLSREEIHGDRINDPQSRYDRIIRFGIRRLLRPMSSVILNACKSGQPQGIAQRISEIHDCSVMAPVVPTILKHVNVDVHDDMLHLTPVYLDENGLSANWRMYLGGKKVY